jgi:ATP-binding cassette subfamily D (ALD) protein 3
MAGHSKLNVGLVTFAAGLAVVAAAIRAAGDKAASRNGADAQQQRGGSDGSTRRGGKGKVVVDTTFVQRVRQLLRICVPRLACAEAGYSAAVAVLMLARTVCDVWMISAQTRIESSIISRNTEGFQTHLMRFIGGMVPIAVVNNLLKYSLAELHIRFRARLTKHLLELYLRRNVFFLLTNADGRIANPDQLLAQDVDRFAGCLVDLFSNTAKPLIDIGLYSYRLGHAIGVGGPATMMAYLALSGVCLTWLRKPVSKLTVREQQLEGEFRAINSRLITSAEEVAFYGGQAREKAGIVRSFDSMTRHLRVSQQFRYSVGVVDSIVAKYLATVVGFYTVSRPFLVPDSARSAVMAAASQRQLIEEYYQNGRMLLNLATAVGRLVLAGREMSRLAGFTSRVTELVDVLQDLDSGYYVRTMVAPPVSAPAPPQPADIIVAVGAEGGQAADSASKPNGAATALAGTAEPPRAARMRVPLRAPGASVETTDHLIRFEGVPLITPNGDMLVRSLDMEVRAGMNVLVAGPNGCGKSSLFRVLGGLWPLFGGRMCRPPPDRIFFIPQRPYLALGSLRDQIIYPHTAEDMRSRGTTDADLLQLLEQVQLGSLAARPGGLSAVCDWADVLSGGEKQRVAMSRVFYHRPQVAVLDECTSAVSVDVEAHMYTRCRELGITLFTVSHRKSLWRFHEYLLRFDGRGGYEFRAMTADDMAHAFGS